MYSLPSTRMGQVPWTIPPEILTSLMGSTVPSCHMFMLVSCDTITSVNVCITAPYITRRSTEKCYHTCKIFPDLPEGIEPFPKASLNWHHQVDDFQLIILVCKFPPARAFFFLDGGFCTQNQYLSACLVEYEG